MTSDNARFGSRYGGKIRRNVVAVESKYRGKKQNCPFCAKKSVKRIAVGIFLCKNCNKKFAGGAYEPETMSKGILKKMFDKTGKLISNR